MTTSKIARRGDMIQERRNYGHDSVDYPDPALDWCVTHLALQFRLGLLAQRRTRVNSSNCNNPRLDGTLVKGAAPYSLERPGLDRDFAEWQVTESNFSIEVWYVPSGGDALVLSFAPGAARFQKTSACRL